MRTTLDLSKPDQAALQKWVDEGEELMTRVDNGRYGLLVAWAFALGQWWADRPWRKKD